MRASMSSVNSESSPFFWNFERFERLFSIGANERKSRAKSGWLTERINKSATYNALRFVVDAPHEHGHEVVLWVVEVICNRSMLNSASREGGTIWHSERLIIIIAEYVSGVLQILAILWLINISRFSVWKNTILHRFPWLHKSQFKTCLISHPHFLSSDGCLQSS